MATLVFNKLDTAVRLLVGALVLLLLVGGVRLLLLGAPEPVIPAKSALQPRFGEGLGEVVEDAESVVQRPLFWNDRQAFVAEPATEAVVEPRVVDTKTALDQATLLGVYTGKVPGAIVHVNDRRFRVAVNEKVEGWTLKRVEPRRAVFARGKTTRALTLEHALPKITTKSAPEAVPASDVEQQATGEST